MIKKIDLEKLQRFSKGLLDSAEEQYIYSFFAENEENIEFKKHIQNEFNAYLKNNLEENHNISYILDRTHHTIHINEKRKKETVAKRIYRWYSIAAAVLLVPILIAGTLWFAGQNKAKSTLAENPVKYTLYAPLGSRISFSLPDGTKGWLNSGSYLKYQLPFNNNRQVAILGEAWFNVAHNASHPFEIAVGDSHVKVLGTKLNVNAYPEEKIVEVVLEEGEIEFYTLGLTSAIKMKPNERLVFKDGTIKVSETSAYKFTSWKEGKLVLRSDPLAEVARRIGRWYNVDVRLVDDELKKHVFRGTFQDDSLQEVLNYLCMTTPIRYRIIDRKLLDDGTIQKKQVLLYNKK